MSTPDQIANYSPFPALSITSVFIGTDDVTIRCSISTSGGTTLTPSWFEAGVFSRFVKFYFVLTGIHFREDDHNSSWTQAAAALNIDAKTRCQFLQNEGLFEDSGFAGLTSIKVVNLSEIILDEAQYRSTKDVNNIIFEIKIPIKLGNDSAEYATDRDPLVGEYTENKISLVAFSHLDVQELADQFDINIPENPTDPLWQIGGNMTYDTLLTRSAEQDPMKVPDTINTFVYSQSGTYRGKSYVTGQPYIGPAHYHNDPLYFNAGDPNGNDRYYGTDAETGTGYTGWMAGAIHNHAPAPDQRQPLLAVRETRNTKVSAVASTFSSVGFSVGFFGANAIYSQEEGQLQLGGPLVEDLDKKFKQTFDPLVLYGRSGRAQGGLGFVETYLDRMRQIYFMKEHKKNSIEFIVDKEAWIHTEHAPPIQASDTGSGVGQTREIGRSYHGILFGLDYRKIVQTNSVYGFLLKKFAPNPIVPDRRDSLLARCDLEEIKIYRRRLSNVPSGNNSMGSNGFEYHRDEEFGEKLLVTSFDRPDLERNTHSENYKMNLFPAGDATGAASIQELDVRYDHLGENEHLRSFLVKDFELFRKVNYGKYTYIVELKIRDGIKSYIVERYNALLEASQVLKEFVVLASRPYVDMNNRFSGFDHQGTLVKTNIAPHGLVPLTSVGSYDYVMDAYTEDFINTIENNDSMWPSKIRNSIETYIDSAVLLTDSGNAAIPIFARKGQLMSAVIPNSDSPTRAKVRYAQELCEQVSSLVGIYEKLLERDKYTPARRCPVNNPLSICSEFNNTEDNHMCKNSLTGGFHGSSTPRAPKKHIIIKADLRFTVEAIREGDVVVSFDVVNPTVLPPGIRHGFDQATERNLLTAAQIAAEYRPSDEAVDPSEFSDRLDSGPPASDYDVSDVLDMDYGYAPTAVSMGPAMPEIDTSALARSLSSSDSTLPGFGVTGRELSALASGLSTLNVEPREIKIFSAAEAWTIASNDEMKGTKTANEQSAKANRLEIIVGQGNARDSDGSAGFGFYYDPSAYNSQAAAAAGIVGGISFGIAGAGVGTATPSPRRSVPANYGLDIERRTKLSAAIEAALCAAAGFRNFSAILERESLEVTAEELAVARNVGNQYYQTMDMLRAATRVFNVGPGMPAGSNSMSQNAREATRNGEISGGISDLPSARTFESPAQLQRADPHAEFFGSRSAPLVLKTGPSLGASGAGTFRNLPRNSRIVSTPMPGSTVMLARIQHNSRSEFAGQGNVRTSNDVGFLEVRND